MKTTDPEETNKRTTPKPRANRGTELGAACGSASPLTGEEEPFLSLSEIRRSLAEGIRKARENNHRMRFKLDFFGLYYNTVRCRALVDAGRVLSSRTRTATQRALATSGAEESGSVTPNIVLDRTPKNEPR